MHSFEMVVFRVAKLQQLNLVEELVQVHLRSDVVCLVRIYLNCHYLRVFFDALIVELLLLKCHLVVVKRDLYGAKVVHDGLEVFDAVLSVQEFETWKLGGAWDGYEIED
mmetsp:Transcript_39038/g.51068  ORF Transcript_39038/g.51068 Transcript_39038/m.51068 type:complete len:109 (+) Transcript_39038:1311-1637(+)